LAATSVVLAGGGLLLLAVALVGEGPSSLLLSPPAIRLAVLLGVVGAAIGCYSWIAMLKLDTTVVEVASAVLAAPALASLLIFVDQAVGLTGANPMIGEPVFAGSVLALLGLTLVAASRWWGAPEGIHLPDGDSQLAADRPHRRDGLLQPRLLLRPGRPPRPLGRAGRATPRVHRDASIAPT